MKSQFKDIVYKTDTFGFKEETGSWDIELGVPDDQNIPYLNNYVYELIKVFLSAFEKLCTPIEIRYSTIIFDLNGKIEKAQEGEVLIIQGKSHTQIFQELKLSLNNPETCLFTTIFIDCDLHVYIEEPKNIINRNISNSFRIPKAATFYFGFVIEPSEDNEEVLIPTDSSISFETSTDIWVERTLDQLSLHWQDNHYYAAKTQPLLEEALRKWETLVGKPICEWNSRYYRDQIFRYGFKSSNQHS
ncbi:hypothetical protein DSM106972_019060 [Dulcicalothrix desertica PCC 7102]|uniref:Uncharacterized protein n=1 Tax=Dulcicalothrix desertica PCC 7102 TaxID=232991 RepID=A0A3S1ARW7_9CYAN|nr:hypothetical protein [Dulcicalothrix desertica]RUT07646.1 hypothetical protein DSM106972_019060 [Dulcicalothrix desertica PCC 7102]TWH39815.1 hypothetical protein CAL7102_09077 [Dulcicalothrix desertica PCC 7102]